MVLIVILIIVGIARSIQTQSDYRQAKKDFLETPDDMASRLRLIEAAGARSIERHSGLEAMAMMEAIQNPVIVNDVSQPNLATNLESLANLHANGHISDTEFEQAKSKLLS